MNFGGSHVVSNDELFLLHSVRVARTELDNVFRGEVERFSAHRRFLLFTRRHEVKIKLLALPWETQQHKRQSTSQQVQRNVSSKLFFLINKTFTFNGNVVDLAVVTHNCENLRAPLNSSGKENYLKRQKHSCIAQRIYDCSSPVHAHNHLHRRVPSLDVY